MKFVEEGQEVIFTYKNKKIVGTVIGAYGNTARIQNEDLKIDTWANVNDLEDLVTDAHQGLTVTCGMDLFTNAMKK